MSTAKVDSQKPSQTPSLPFELEALRLTKNYQSWLRDTTLPFMGKRILEVGSGIGNMSQHLPIRELLILSEVEDRLRDHLVKQTDQLHPNNTKVKVRKLDLLATDYLEELVDENLDTIVSYNVLEHINDDQQIMSNFVSILKKSNAPGPKRIVTFAPAHQWAYGELDRSFKHFRRYNRRNFQQIFTTIDPQIRHHSQYMNLIGLIGWIWLGRILRLKQFGIKSATKFEKICPHVRRLDDFVHRDLHLPMGQSILSVATIT